MKSNLAFLNKLNHDYLAAEHFSNLSNQTDMSYCGQAFATIYFSFLRLTTNKGQVILFREFGMVFKKLFTFCLPPSRSDFHCELEIYAYRVNVKNIKELLS